MRAIIALIAVLLFLFYFSFAEPTFAAGFTLSSTQTSINADDEFNVDVYFSISATNGTTYYLRGVFYPVAKNYCGYTWNGNAWYNGPYTVNNGWQQLLAVTVNQSSWSGQLKAKIDPSDENCQNSGNYYFKIQRYTSGGSSNFDDQNSLSLNVSIPTSTPTPNPTDTPTSTPTAAPTNTPTPNPTKTPTPTPTLKPSVSPMTKETDVLGEDTESEETISPTDMQSSDENTLISNKTKNTGNWFQKILIFIGIVFIAVCAILLFLKIKKREFAEDE
jgi:hypothetical protein